MNTQNTLVLLPGMDGTGELFAPLLYELKQLDTTLKVIVMAYPRDIPLDYAALTDRVVQQLSPDESFVLLGESFSGPIATQLAQQLGKRCQGLILCVSFVHSSVRMPRLTRALSHLIPFGSMSRWPMRELPEALQNQLKKIVKTVSPTVWRSRFRAALNVDERHTLRSLTCPILYLRARNDRIVAASVADTIASIQPRTQIVDLDTSHFLLQTEASTAAHHIVDFMQRLN